MHFELSVPDRSMLTTSRKLSKNRAGKRRRKAVRLRSTEYSKRRVRRACTCAWNFCCRSRDTSELRELLEPLQRIRYHRGYTVVTKQRSPIPSLPRPYTFSFRSERPWDQGKYGRVGVAVVLGEACCSIIISLRNTRCSAGK